MTDRTTTAVTGATDTGRLYGLGLDADWRLALRAPLVLVLTATLVLQLGLALLLGGGRSMAPAAQDVPLLDLDFDGVTELSIGSGDGQTLVLRRDGAAWLLPALDDFPVSAARVDTLLDDLDELRRPLPVATSADARRRFRVADDAFERRLTLRADDGEATLIVGDSPGFRRLFARLDGEDAVYDIRLALFDLSAEADDWIDRGQLQLDPGEITRIAATGGSDAGSDDSTGDDWALVRGEEGWSLEGSDEVVDEAAADALANAVATLGYTGVLAPDADAEYDLDAPALVLTIEHNGKQRRYLLAPIGDTGDYALKGDGEPYVYRIGAFDAATLVDTNRAKLLGEDEPAGDIASEDDGATGDAGDDTAAQPGTADDAEGAADAGGAEVAERAEAGAAAPEAAVEQAEP